MKEFAEILPRYRQLRKASSEFVGTILDGVDRDLFMEGARRLGMLGPRQTLILNGESEFAVLNDFLLHDVWRNGRNVVQQYAIDAPPAPGSNEECILRGLCAARYSLFRVTHVEPGIGLRVADLLQSVEHEIIDISFASTATTGMTLAMRVTCPDGFWFSTGASLPVHLETKVGILGGLAHTLRTNPTAATDPTDETWSDVTALIIRNCLKNAESSSVAYQNTPQAGERVRPVHRLEEGGEDALMPLRAEPRVGRNEPCPCGSGKKWKKCCGAVKAGSVH
jgi:hypothetical protein